mmetsp:Transcript_92565/g.239031  ORF Transcript_92565/g.239031 Transcript_92565/m.239031 type:complete len:317 (+) Transcript_92565:211-1161(+)
MHLNALTAQANLDHDLVHLGLLQAATMLSHKLVEEALKLPVGSDRVQVHEREKVREDVAVGIPANLRVQPCALKLVNCREQQGRSRGHLVVQGVSDQACEHRRRLAQLAGGLALLYAEVDLRIAADHRDDTLKVVVLSQLADLEEVPEGRAHVAAVHVLLPALLRAEGCVARELGRLLGHDAEFAHTSSGQNGLLALQQTLDVCDHALELLVAAVKGLLVTLEGITACHAHLDRAQVLRDLQGDVALQHRLDVPEARHHLKVGLADWGILGRAWVLKRVGSAELRWPLILDDQVCDPEHPVHPAHQRRKCVGAHLR